MEWFVVESPIGELGLAASGDALAGVSFGARGPAGAEPKPAVADPELTAASPPPSVAAAGRQLAEYFAGERTEFDVPIVIVRGSEFERAVWREIAAIPYGETSSYGAIARAVGEPGGAQAVGTACNRNPLPLVVACHRVIGSDGKLVGFGGGLHRKRFLLQLEAKVHIERTFAP